jgi:hypothetical protein
MVTLHVDSKSPWQEPAAVDMMYRIHKVAGIDMVCSTGHCEGWRLAEWRRGIGVLQGE